jgi:LPPG:FO 2-phospho-L-lactate transferase
MITFLSGGTGTPKLLRGMRQVLDDDQISVVVNTGEDIWMSGNHISPDIDTVMYLFLGILNTDTWWGVRNDSFTTHEMLKDLAADEFIAIGDRDRAVHIARGDLLRRGYSLTEATMTLCRQFGVRASILPMTDADVTTRVKTSQGSIHFQEYWVKKRGNVEILGVEWFPDNHPHASREALNALRKSEVVIIGPSNPITSILPILRCGGVREVLAEQFVVGISPFIGDTPVSGPAAALMRAQGYPPNSYGTMQVYSDFLDLFVQDIRDTVNVPGSVRLDTLMTDEKKSRALAAAVVRLIRKKGKGSFRKARDSLRK